MVLRSPMLYELCLLLMEFSSSSLRSGVEKLSALYPHSYQGQYFSFLVHGSWWCSPFHIRTKIHKSHRSARLSLVFQLRLSRQPAMNLIWILKWTFFYDFDWVTGERRRLCERAKGTAFQDINSNPPLSRSQMTFWTFFTSIWCCHENQFLFLLSVVLCFMTISINDLI